MGLVDPSLNGEFDAEEACKFLKIGLLCTQDSPKLRPAMSTVVKLLKGEEQVDDSKITKPGLITDFMDLKIRGPPKTRSQKKTTLSQGETKSETQDYPSYNVSSGSEILDSLEDTTLSSVNSTSAGTTFTAQYDQSVTT